MFCMGAPTSPEQLAMRRAALHALLGAGYAWSHSTILAALDYDTEYAALQIALHGDQARLVDVWGQGTELGHAAQVALASSSNQNVLKEVVDVVQRPIDPDVLDALLQNGNESVCKELIRRWYKLDGPQFVKTWRHLLEVHNTVWCDHTALLRMETEAPTPEQLLAYAQAVVRTREALSHLEFSGVETLVRYMLMRDVPLGDELQATILQRSPEQCVPLLDLVSMGPLSKEALVSKVEWGGRLVDYVDAFEAGRTLAVEVAAAVAEFADIVPLLVLHAIEHPDIADLQDTLERAFSPLRRTDQHIRVSAWRTSYLAMSPLWRKVVQSVPAGDTETLLTLFTKGGKSLHLLGRMCAENVKLTEGLALAPDSHHVDDVEDVLPLVLQAPMPRWRGLTVLDEAVSKVLTGAHSRLSPTAFSYVVRRLRDWTGPLPELIELADSLYSR